MVRRICVDCPLAGRRADGLSSGEVQEELQSCQDACANDLLLALDDELSTAQKSELVLEYHSGICALRFIFALKLGHWSQSPWTIYRLCSTNLSLTRAAMRSCFEGACDHARIQELRSGVVALQARRFQDGEDLLDVHGKVRPCMRQLLEVIGAGRFAWTMEWLGESEHARTSRGMQV